LEAKLLCGSRPSKEISVLPEVPIDNPASLANFIAKECKETWDDERKALLLTRLGITIRENLASGTTLEGLAPYGLLRFIKNELSTSVLIREPDLPDGTIGIIPVNAKIDNPEELFRTRGPHHMKGLPSAANHRSNRRVRYRSALWTALKNPLDASKRRFLRADFHHFVDMDATAPIPPNSIEIFQSDIVGIQGPLPAEEAGKIHLAIEKFIAKNQIDTSRAIDVPQDRSSSQLSIKATEKGGAIDLGSLFEVLSNSDLARISVPLDIVAEALRKLR
jgi:hypothetical protein